MLKRITVSSSLSNVWKVVTEKQDVFDENGFQIWS